MEALRRAAGTSEPEGRGAAWTEKRATQERATREGGASRAPRRRARKHSEPEGRGGAWTEELATREGGASRAPRGRAGNTVFGTPGFTAPERLSGGSATPASDLWSLGATLYAAVEGRGPFERLGGAAAIVAGVISEDAPRAPSAGPLTGVIGALLRADPGQRPDAAEAARLLADAAADAEANTAYASAIHVD